MRHPALLSGLAAAALVVAAPLPGLATELFDPSFASCTGTNCSSITIGGVVNAFGGQPKPWTAEFRATAGRCLRLDVLTQGADLEIVAVAPDGSVYRNDDTVGLLPQVRINPTNSGFYTVQIAQYAGSVTETSFTLAFGQYNLGNPNCLGATTPERRAVVTTKTRAN